MVGSAHFIGVLLGGLAVAYTLVDLIPPEVLTPPDGNPAVGTLLALSALCLGLGTMIGYRRIVRTIGERMGRRPMTPAQDGSAELGGAALIATAGWHGMPVGTTHIVSSGVAGTMAGSGAGVPTRTVRAIILAWMLTLPATILISGALFYVLG